jgi:hypothetical protein
VRLAQLLPGRTGRAGAAASHAEPAAGARRRRAAALRVGYRRPSARTALAGATPLPRRHAEALLALDPDNAVGRAVLARLDGTSRRLTPRRPTAQHRVLARHTDARRKP